MATFTSKAEGNWSASGQTTWNEVGVPGDGDTVTLSHNVAVDVNTTVGSSPATGGTAAIQFASVTGKSLTVNAGITLTCKGDFTFANSDTQSQNKLILSAGSTFTFLPPSAQQYKFNCAVNSHIVCNGTSGSHVTVKTDLSSSGLAAYTVASGYTVSGFHTCTYTDFIDMGTSSQFGVKANRSRGGVSYPDANSHLTITDCTFTRSSITGSFGGGNWDGNVTFQRNSFASSTEIVIAGTYNCCAQFLFTIAGSAGVWLIDTNGFDADVAIGTYRTRLAFTNNIVRRVYLASGSWTAGKFDGNIFTNCADQTLLGPVASSYFYTSDTTNPHWIFLAANGHLTDSVFDPPSGVAADGDILFASATNTSTNVTGNLVLSRSNKAAGVLLSLGHSETGAFNCNHNTALGQTDTGLIRTNETSDSYLGQVASCQSNIVYSSASTTGILFVGALGAGAVVVDAVTISDYNAGRNLNTGTCTYNTSTSQAGVTGYSAIKVSNANPFPNAQVGLHDLTISADPFVDSSRNIDKWAAANGQAETAAAGIAYAVANPVAATDATTGLRAWVRDGFKVTGAAGLLLKDAGHDYVTIGAMEYISLESGGIGSARGLRLLRP